MSDLHLVQLCAAKLSCLGPVLQLYLLVLWKQECPNIEEKAKNQYTFHNHKSIQIFSIRLYSVTCIFIMCDSLVSYTPLYTLHKLSNDWKI